MGAWREANPSGHQKGFQRTSGWRPLAPGPHQVDPGGIKRRRRIESGCEQSCSRFPRTNKLHVPHRQCGSRGRVSMSAELSVCRYEAWAVGEWPSLFLCTVNVLGHKRCLVAPIFTWDFTEFCSRLLKMPKEPYAIKLQLPRLT